MFQSEGRLPPFLREVELVAAPFALSDFFIVVVRLPATPLLAKNSVTPHLLGTLSCAKLSVQTGLYLSPLYIPKAKNG